MKVLKCEFIRYESDEEETNEKMKNGPSQISKNNKSIVFQIEKKKKAEQMRDKIIKKNGKDFLEKVATFIKQQKNQKIPEEKV